MRSAAFLSLLIPLALLVGACDRSPSQPPTEPTLQITSPFANSTAETDTVVIRGMAATPTGLAKLTYRLDDQDSTPIPMDPGGTETTFEFVLRNLAEGAHSVLIVTSDADGRAAEAVVSFSVDLPEPPFDPRAFRLVPFASGFERPLYATAPSGDDRLFVVEQWGRIMVVENGVVRPTPFLDIRDLVHLEGEQGLLGLAFHPDYASNGQFFVSYIDENRDSRIERYSIGEDSYIADRSSAEVILIADQPTDSPMHKAGTIVFGPDGKLYIPFGDAGVPERGLDVYGNSQNTTNFLGSVLRIDVDGGSPYVVPSDNPRPAQSGARPELIAYGLRNPWQMSVDAQTGTLYVPDVGEQSWEEVNVLSSFSSVVNYGWPRMEGPECIGQASCSTASFTLPTVVEAHPDWCSITGGEVYHGNALPQLEGHYVYGDLCNGHIKSFRFESGRVTDRIEWEIESVPILASISSGADGELYFASIVAGILYRLESAP